MIGRQRKPRKMVSSVIRKRRPCFQLLHQANAGTHHHHQQLIDTSNLISPFSHPFRVKTACQPWTAAKEAYHRPHARHLSAPRCTCAPEPERDLPHHASDHVGDHKSTRVLLLIEALSSSPPTRRVFYIKRNGYSLQAHDVTNTLFSRSGRSTSRKVAGHRAVLTGDPSWSQLSIPLWQSR